MKRLSIQAITVLTNVITGGSANSGKPPLGIYRSKTQLEEFFGYLGIELSRDETSRVPAVKATLRRVNDHNRDKLVDIMRSATDPRDFAGQPDKLNSVVELLNAALVPDGYRLSILEGQVEVQATPETGVVAQQLNQAAQLLNYRSVEEECDRALRNAEKEPKVAIASACSLLESVCKCLIDARDLQYPARQDLGSLAKVVMDDLGLRAGRVDLPENIARDVRQIISGMTTTIAGISALRTHASNAHGRGTRELKVNGEEFQVDGRMARLAIHAASTAALFLIDTHQRCVPADPFA